MNQMLGLNILQIRVRYQRNGKLILIVAYMSFFRLSDYVAIFSTCSVGGRGKGKDRGGRGDYV